MAATAQGAQKCWDAACRITGCFYLLLLLSESQGMWESIALSEAGCFLTALWGAPPACHSCPPLVPAVPKLCQPGSTHPTPLLLQREEEEEDALRARSLTALSCRAVGKLPPGRGNLVPPATTLSWRGKCGFIIWAPSVGRGKRGCKEDKRRVLRNSTLCTARCGGEAARRRGNMHRTKRCGQAASVKFPYRKSS